MEMVLLADERELAYERTEIRENGRLYAYGPGERRYAWFAPGYWWGRSNGHLVMAMADGRRAKVIRMKGDAERLDDEPDHGPRAKVRLNGKVSEKPVLAEIEVELRALEDDNVMRLLECRVNLVETYKQGLPPIEVLPGSSEAIFKGRRHSIAAPAKDGKSFSELVRYADMAVAGVRVIILDRENGRGIYSERLETIVKAREWSAKEEARLAENLVYFEYPVLNRNSGDALRAMAELFTSDLVVFDSQRMFLTDLGLKESESDDFAEFMERLIDPLFRCGIATMVLDNTGHDSQDRGRGTSSKLDLFDQGYSLKKVADFDRKRSGAVEIKTKFSRLGVYDSFELELGGGQIGHWHRPGESDLERVARIVLAAEGAKLPMTAKEVLRLGRTKHGLKIAQSEGLEKLKSLEKLPTNGLTKIEGGYVWRE